MTVLPSAGTRGRLAEAPAAGLAGVVPGVDPELTSATIVGGVVLEVMTVPARLASVPGLPPGATVPIGVCAAG